MSRPTGQLDGRAAIVTGAASGIGAAIATAFAAEGARVLAVDLPEARFAETVAGHPSITVLAQDVAVEGAAERIVAAPGSKAYVEELALRLLGLELPEARP